MSSTRSSATTVERGSSLVLDPFQRIQPHLRTAALLKAHDNQHCATSQIAWSPDGTWMVGVHDHGLVSMWHRDKSVVMSEETQADNPERKPNQENAGSEME